MIRNFFYSPERRLFIKRLVCGSLSLELGTKLLVDGENLGLFVSAQDNVGSDSVREGSTPRVYTLTLVSKYARDALSYTQGLVYEYDEKLQKGVLYESGGRYGRSLLRKVEADTGKVLRQVPIGKQYFAEGLALIENRLYLLTWREHVCFVYDKETLEPIDEFRYAGEGWGLTYDGSSFVMSNGSSKIRFLDPKTFRQKRTIDVHYSSTNGKRRSLANLNELETVDGEIWANVYEEEYVVRIDPATGLILGKALNFSLLTPSSLKSSSEYVLNGLAFDAKERRLYVTGKCWPIMYVFSVEAK